MNKKSMSKTPVLPVNKTQECYWEVRFAHSDSSPAVAQTTLTGHAAYRNNQKVLWISEDRHLFKFPQKKVPGSKTGVTALERPCAESLILASLDIWLGTSIEKGV